MNIDAIRLAFRQRVDRQAARLASTIAGSQYRARALAHTVWSGFPPFFKPGVAKVTLFLALVGAGLSPLFFYGSGPALILPVVEIFWLDGIVQALGAPVAINGGVDAFNLVPANVIGIVLIGVGSAVSLVLQYVVACVLVETMCFTR